MSRQLLLEQVQKSMPSRLANYQKNVLNPFKFKLFLLIKLPMAFLAGIKLKSLNENVCSVTVPYKWLNQNPFKSTYFAVSSMAGEMCGGLLSLMYCHNSNPSVATLVIKVEATFSKKATGLTTFICEDGYLIKDAVEKTVFTGEGTSAVTTSIGRNEMGEEECRFMVTWSFKSRK